MNEETAHNRNADALHLRKMIERLELVIESGRGGAFLQLVPDTSGQQYLDWGPIEIQRDFLWLLEREHARVARSFAAPLPSKLQLSILDDPAVVGTRPMIRMQFNLMGGGPTVEERFTLDQAERLAASMLDMVKVARGESQI